MNEIAVILAAWINMGIILVKLMPPVILWILTFFYLNLEIHVDDASEGALVFSGWGRNTLKWIITERFMVRPY